MHSVVLEHNAQVVSSGLNSGTDRDTCWHLGHAGALLDAPRGALDKQPLFHYPRRLMAASRGFVFPTKMFRDQGRG